MAIAPTCPLLVWLSITHHQSSCSRKYEIMSLESNQSNVCQGLLKSQLVVLVSEEVLQICFNKMFILKEVDLSTFYFIPITWFCTVGGWVSADRICHRGPEFTPMLPPECPSSAPFCH